VSSPDRPDVDQTFASLVEALDLDDEDATRDGVPVTELSDVELLREFQYLRVELMELRELVHPTTQRGRDLHSRRAACQLELRRRGVIQRSSALQVLAVVAPDETTARCGVNEFLRREVAAHEIEDVIGYGDDPDRFQREIARGMDRRMAALRNWLAFVDPARSGDDRPEIRLLHEDWAAMLEGLFGERDIDVEAAMGVGLELAAAVELLCGEYGSQVGFYDLHASTGWPDFVTARTEDAPQHQWLVVARVR
jgi:hypothetical protein